MRAIFLGTTLLLAALAGCATPAAEKADVVATFYPTRFLADRLVGEDLRTATLVPDGVEPHDWEPAATDITRLADARVVLAQGAGLDAWVEAFIGELKEPRPALTLTTSGIELVEGDEGLDPHTWLAPALYAQQASSAEAALVAAFPDKADAIRARGATLQDELAKLHADFEAGLATCDAPVIIANHDAYGYLAGAYGFEVVALSGLSPEAEPTTESLTRAIEIAREHNLSIIFFEELVSPRVAEIVATEVKAQTRVLSPIEGAPEEGDYFSAMRANLANLREAMRCT